jgi:hypothetical protein
MSDQQAPREPLSLTKPMLGMAICVVLFVVGVKMGFGLLCGPAPGWGLCGYADPTHVVLGAIVIFGPLAGCLGCLMWFLFAVARNSLRDRGR